MPIADSVSKRPRPPETGAIHVHQSLILEKSAKWQSAIGKWQCINAAKPLSIRANAADRFFLLATLIAVLLYSVLPATPATRGPLLLTAFVAILLGTLVCILFSCVGPSVRIGSSWVRPRRRRLIPGERPSRETKQSLCWKRFSQLSPNFRSSVRPSSN